MKIDLKLKLIFIILIILSVILTIPIFMNDSTRVYVSDKTTTSIITHNNDTIMVNKNLISTNNISKYTYYYIRFNNNDEIYRIYKNAVDFDTYLDLFNIYDNNPNKYTIGQMVFIFFWQIITFFIIFLMLLESDIDIRNIKNKYENKLWLSMFLFAYIVSVIPHIIISYSQNLLLSVLSMGILSSLFIYSIKHDILDKLDSDLYKYNTVNEKLKNLEINYKQIEI